MENSKLNNDFSQELTKQMNRRGLTWRYFSLNPKKTGVLEGREGGA